VRQLPRDQSSLSGVANTRCGVPIPGDLYPRVGFIVTNMARRAENVVALYN
jgi:hypothetical protein